MKRYEQQSNRKIKDKRSRLRGEFDKRNVSRKVKYFKRPGRYIY